MPPPISVGTAIGLSGQPKSYVPTAIGQIRAARQEEQRLLGEARKARAKELEDLDKYKADLDKFVIDSNKGILPIDEKLIKAKTAELYKYVNEKWNNGESIRGDSKVNELKNNLSLLVSQKQQSAKNFYDDAGADPNLYTINERYSKAALSSLDDPEASNAWNELTHGTGIYTGGLKSAIDKTNYADYFEKRGAAIKVPIVQIDTPEGLKTTVQRFTPTEIDAIWEEEKQLSLVPYQKQLALLTADHKLTPELADITMKNNFARGIENVYRTDITQPGQALRLGVGGATSGKFYYNLESPQSAKSGGKSIIVFGQEGGTALPFNSFQGEGGKEIIGRPTGKIYNLGKGKNDFQMEVLVPKPQAGGLSLDVTTITPETNPDKYEKVYVPLSTSDVNRRKFQGEYGGQDIEDVYSKIVGAIKTPESRTKATTKSTTQSDFDAKWKALKPGQTIVAPDGKTYKKK